jgi:hemerythrin superfamily protein
VEQAVKALQAKLIAAYFKLIPADTGLPSRLEPKMLAVSVKYLNAEEETRMFDWMLPETHAIAILKKDHHTVKALFEEFEKAETSGRKTKIIDKALTELKVHAILEEEIFYPTVRAHVGKDIMNEADEEHHVAKVLIAELDTMGSENDHRDAKFTVLAESVQHHIREEESEMLPKAKVLDIDFEALGQRMLARKKQLLKDGIPTDSEHAMVAKSHGRADSPAAAAARTKPTTRKAPARGSSARASKRETHTAR